MNMSSIDDQSKPPCCMQNDTKNDDDATLETVWGSCDNSYCQCETCLCGEGCQCTPLVPTAITATVRNEDEETVQFGASIRGLSCQSCVTSVTRAAMLSSGGVRNVEIDLSSGYGLIEYNPIVFHGNEMDAMQFILDAIEDAGFEAELDLSTVVTETLDMEEEEAGRQAETVAEKQVQECGICLDPLKSPVTLPCGHTFSSECLEVWRSKYDARQVTERTCPICRSQMPPTKEMISQLESWRRAKEQIKADGDIHSSDYLLAKGKVEELEANIGNWNDVLSDVGDEYIELPDHIAKAAMQNDIRKVLNWIGPPSRTDYNPRLNAKDPSLMQITLLHAAAVNGHIDLTTILLQRGANVNAVDANGYTPLEVRSLMNKADNDETMRLLLEWGAGIPSDAFQHCNPKLANVIKSELDGRRCEIINMESSTNLNGKTCVVKKYVPEKDRYKVMFERSRKVFLVRQRNLKRRDRIPADCGYYITYNNGKAVRRNFDSNEECHDFIKSLTAVKDAKISAEAATAAEARAEQAAETLLAELSLEDAIANMSSKKGEKRRRKKRR